MKLFIETVINFLNTMKPKYVKNEDKFCIWANKTIADEEEDD